MQRSGLLFAGTKRVFRPHGEAIDVGPVKAGDIDRRNHVAGEDAAQCLGQRHFLRFERPKIKNRPKAALRFVAVDDIEELILLHAFVLRHLSFVICHSSVLDCQKYDRFHHGPMTNDQ